VDPGQSRRHIGAGKGDHLILLEAQLGQGRLPEEDPERSLTQRAADVLEQQQQVQRIGW
jgi:hypothetical protein